MCCFFSFFSLSCIQDDPGRDSVFLLLFFLSFTLGDSDGDDSGGQQKENFASINTSRFKGEQMRAWRNLWMCQTRHRCKNNKDSSLCQLVPR